MIDTTAPTLSAGCLLLPCPTVKAVIYYTVEDDTDDSGLPYDPGYISTGDMDKEEFAIRFPLFKGEDGDSLWWEIDPELRDSATIVFFDNGKEVTDFRIYEEDRD